MRVLVTGASGFVGQHMMSLLRAEGEEAVGWGLSTGGGERVETVDLLDAAAVARQDVTGFDAVVHLAGLADVGASFRAPGRYLSENATMQSNLLDGLLAAGVSPRVLVVSTGGVYAGTSAVLTEDSVTEPSNPYVISKLGQEMLAHYYGKRGLDVMVARPFNHVGPGQRPGFLVADVARQIALFERAGGGVLKVGELSASRDYTDVRDVVAAYLDLLRGGTTGGVYNVCSGVSRTAEEIVGLLSGLARVPVRVEVDPKLLRPIDQLVVNASADKLRSATGWQPRIPLATTLADTLDYWRQNAGD